MKKRISKKGILLGLVLFLGLSLLSIVGALGTQLACLEEGQRIYFSDCNPSIDDYICYSQSCQLCVNEVRSGVYCPASINDCNEIGGGCTQIIDEPIETPEVNPDVIVLISPENDFSVDGAGNITFSFEVTAYRFEKCELILDGDIVATKIRPIYRDRQYDLTYFVEEGEHTWRIDCTEVEIDGGELILSETRSLIVGSGSRGSEESNEITLVNPESNFITIEGNINFVFNVSGDLTEITQCNLNLNEQVFAISPINAENTITQSVAAGSYTWDVECLSADETLASKSRSFTVNLASAPPPNTGGGGGGGGSSGGGGGSVCTTTWNCTAWSSCIDGKQTRTCSKEKTYCSAPAKPSETQNCTISNSTGNQQNTENTENVETTTTTQNRLAGITGAIVGGIKNNKIPVVIVFVVIIAIASILSYNYQKKKRE